jgi:predicted MPP superfamily phosphohydrolase
LLVGDYFQRLQNTGPVICLVARLDAILQQLHLILGARYHDPNQRAMALGELKREWAVRQLHGIHELDVTALNESEMIEAVITLWQEVAIERA